MPFKPTAEDLEISRDPRFLLQRMKRQEALVMHLESAKRLRLDNGLSLNLLDSALNQAKVELKNLGTLVGGRIVHRKKAKVDSTQTCIVFIDECGAHSLTAKEDFEAFCLAAIIVHSQDAAVFDAKWRRWKHEHLGSEL